MRQISSNHQSPVRNVKTDSDILSEEENLPNGDAFCQSPLLETKHVAQQKPERVSPFSFWEGRWQERSQTAYLSLLFHFTNELFGFTLKVLWGSPTIPQLHSHRIWSKQYGSYGFPKILRHRVIWTSMALGLWRHTSHAILEVTGYSLVRWCCLLEGFQICQGTLVTGVMSPHCCWVLVQLSGLQLAELL